jgi:N-glycosidase YbiA
VVTVAQQHQLEVAMPESTTPAVINFYSTIGEHGCFSNFSRHAIFLKEKRWPTSEHYFQAQKFAGTEHEEEVRKCKTPSAAASMGRSRKLPLRRDWESVKDQIMLDAVRAKFTQHDELKTVLLGTGEAKLVEHTEKDSYWGDGGDGSGKNRLGQILMQVREELRAEAEREQPPE